MPPASGRNVRIDPPIAQWMALLKLTPERVDLEVRKEWRGLAADVRDDARTLAASSHPVARTQRTTPRQPKQHWRDLVNSIRSGSTGTAPHVAIGRDSVPWALGFEFGSLGGPHKAQFPAWRGNGLDGGYFFFPAVRSNYNRVVADAVEAVRRAMSETFPE